MVGAADASFVVSIGCSLVVVVPATGSALPAGHGPDFCAFLRAAVFAPQRLKSPPDADGDMGTPLVCGAEDVTVAVDDPEDVEAIEEEEFARWALLRGMNMRVTSSAFIAAIPP